eukprot:TRINITY_DN2532_c0_g1_i19.p1 TRINITY_DN2532_c0_g1~~TRINITY_DN2532_c0_g1_i19.p1  ORF type:complete len:493 (+),score=80.34 TRINITY_DN2532_c0_g1_i19:352-1830(+)
MDHFCIFPFIYYGAIDANGKIIMTKDGRTLLSNVDARHPIASLVKSHVIDSSEDGSLTGVILVCDLITRAHQLLHEGHHPIDITTGWNKALYLLNGYIPAISCAANLIDLTARCKTVTKLLRSFLDPKIGIEKSKDFCILFEKALGSILKGEDWKNRLQSLGDWIQIIGDNALLDTHQGVYDGFLLQISSKPNYEEIPTDGKTLLICDFFHQDQYPGSKTRSIQKDRERALRYRALRENINKLGVKIILTNDIGLQRFVDEDVSVAVCSLSEIQRLSRATLHPIVMDMESVSSRHLREYRSIQLVAHNASQAIIQLSCTSPSTKETNSVISIVWSSGRSEPSNNDADAIQRAIRHIEFGFQRECEPATIAVGGCFEAAIASYLFKQSQSAGDKSSRVIESLADACMAVCSVLATNASSSPESLMSQLMTKHAATNYGWAIDGYSNSPVDLSESGPWCFVHDKMVTLQRAVELSCSLLRINGIVCQPRMQISQ